MSEAAIFPFVEDQTDRYRRNGRRAITMSRKDSKKADHPITPDRKHPNEPRLDYSLYDLEGYLSWRDKLQKVGKRH